MDVITRDETTFVPTQTVLGLERDNLVNRHTNVNKNDTTCTSSSRTKMRADAPISMKAETLAKATDIERRSGGKMLSR